MTRNQQRAQELAELKDEINLAQAEYNDKAEILIQKVGDGGETFTTPLGQVQVTQRTADRLGDGYNLIFDRDVYDKLAPENQKALQDLGVVRLERTQIRGQAPKVVVRLT